MWINLQEHMFLAPGPGRDHARDGTDASHAQDRGLVQPDGSRGCTEPRTATRRRGNEEIARLVARAAGGDQHAWNALVQQFGGLVWTIARAHRLGDADAADVAQLTWLRLVEHLADLKDPGRVGAWLATTARRECLRVLRHTKRNVPSGDDDMLDEESDEPAPHSRLLGAERDQALWRSFARLPPRDRILLRLLTSCEMPRYEEIAAALDMPIGSIGPTRARALERLRRQLQRDGALAALTD